MPSAAVQVHGLMFLLSYLHYVTLDDYGLPQFSASFDVSYA